MQAYSTYPAPGSGPISSLQGVPGTSRYMKLQLLEPSLAVLGYYVVYWWGPGMYVPYRDTWTLWGCDFKPQVRLVLYLEPASPGIQQGLP